MAEKRSKPDREAPHNGGKKRQSSATRPGSSLSCLQRVKNFIFHSKTRTVLKHPLFRAFLVVLLLFLAANMVYRNFPGLFYRLSGVYRCNPGFIDSLEFIGENRVFVSHHGIRSSGDYTIENDTLTVTDSSLGTFQMKIVDRRLETKAPSGRVICRPE